MIINDYDNLNALYVFEILNLEDPGELSIKSNLSISFKLKPFKKIYGKYVNLVNTLNQKTDLDNNAIYNYTQSFDFYTDENINDKFYFFSFKERPEKISDLFYSFNFDEAINPEDESNKVITISLKNADLLKELNNNFLTFEIVENWEKKEINKIKLRFKNYSLINEINFFGNITDDNNNTFFSKIKPLNFEFKNDDYVFLPNITNPILTNNNNLILYSKFWESLNLLDLKNLIRQVDKNTKLLELNAFFTNTFYAQIEEALYKCLWVNKVISSGFKGFNKDQIDNFKQTLFNGNDQALFIDKHLSDLFNRLRVAGFNLEAKRLTNLILMLSESLKSRFCWKNGMNTEHKLGLPFYVDVKSPEDFNTFEKYKNNTQFFLNSNWFYFDGDNVEPIAPSLFNNNLKQLDEYVLTMPFLPEKLEEQNYTNTPIDFNTKNSLNFNYLTWSAVKKSKFLNIFNKFEKEAENTETILKQTEIKKFSQHGSGIGVHWFIDRNVFDDYEAVMYNFDVLKNHADIRFRDKLKNFLNVNDYIEAWILKNIEIPRGYKIVKGSSLVYSKSSQDSAFQKGMYSYETGKWGVGPNAGRNHKTHFEFYITYSIQKINELADKTYKNDWVWSDKLQYFNKVFYENQTPENIELVLNFDKSNYFAIDKIIYLEVKSFFMNDIEVAINDEDYKSYKLLANDKPTITTTIIKI